MYHISKCFYIDEIKDNYCLLMQKKTQKKLIHRIFYNHQEKYSIGTWKYCPGIYLGP